MGDVPFAKALIEGHTGSKGTEEYNQALSDRRDRGRPPAEPSRHADPHGFGHVTD